MSRFAIRAEHVAKVYRIGASTQKLRTFREALTAGLKSSVGRLTRSGDSTPAAREYWALNDVSFELQPGEVIGVIGANGAGKSTLLKILSRITEPSHGKIRLRGRVASLLEVGTGFHQELTGRENIYLNGAILGMRKAEIDRKFDEIVAFSEIEKFLDTPVKRYSSGMYVRLAFAVAAHLDPEILIVDEVLAVGDAAFQKKCLGKMEDVATGGGRTILFVSHNMGIIRSLCSRSIVLRQGEVLYDGDTEEAIEHYERNLTDGADSGVFRAEEDDTLPMQILEIELVDSEGNRTSKVDLFERISLCVRYCVRRPLVGSNIGLAVNFRGSPLILSFDSDEDPHLVDHREPGEYEVRIDLPAQILKAGLYSIYMDCGILNHSEKIQKLDSCLQFEVRESMNTSLKSFAARRAGLLATRLRWQASESVFSEVNAYGRGA
jgi:lipopolysaccharide transport system ATP-binding protein